MWGKIRGTNAEVHRGDLPAGLDLGPAVAVDCETTGLHPERDRLCVVQLSQGDGTSHLVQFPKSQYNAPNLKAVLGNPRITKIFHYARFDLLMIKRHLGIVVSPVYCTKIASKLVRTYTDRHGLKDLCRELLNVELSKEQQSSDWGADTLTSEQVQYAASDVRYLHQLKEILDVMLAREGRTQMAESCFKFLETRVALDLAGWMEEDIFAH